MRRNTTLSTINIIVLLLSMTLCGLLSLSFGKELQFDLAGYHFYNPYAVLHHRINTLDYWPPSVLQVFITPTLDFISYFLIQHTSPMMTEFVLGGLHGINAALIFYISRFFLAFFIDKSAYQIGLAIVCAVTGLFAPTVLPGIGGFFNDNMVSIFILSFMLYWIQILNSRNFSSLPIIFAHMLLGIALGSKLTFGTYVIGALAATICLTINIKEKFAIIFYSTLGITIGMLLADGYWMWLLWKNFQNPFFPFFNAIFHSPYFPSINWSEPRYVPREIIQILFFPFYFSTGKMRTVEFYFSDLRFVIVYVLFILFFISLIDSKKRAAAKNIPVWWFYLFFIFTYIAWQAYFSIMRYLNVLQMLAPLLCMLLVLQLMQRTTDRFFSLLFIVVSIVNIMRPIGMERTHRFGTDYFNVKLPAFVAQHNEATVLLAYSAFVKIPSPKPNHYLIPYFPAAWRFSGIPFYPDHYEVPLEVSQFVRQGPKQVYLLASIAYMRDMYKAASTMHLRATGRCGIITSDRQRLSHETVLLCPMEKMS